jgi:hypothetical protein
MNKYHRLGLKYSLKGTNVPDDAYMKKIKNILEEHDINIQIGG